MLCAPQAQTRPEQGAGHLPPGRVGEQEQGWVCPQKVLEEGVHSRARNTQTSTLSFATEMRQTVWAPRRAGGDAALPGPRGQGGTPAGPARRLGPARAQASCPSAVGERSGRECLGGRTSTVRGICGRLGLWGTALGPCQPYLSRHLDQTQGGPHSGRPSSPDRRGPRVCGWVWGPGIPAGPPPWARALCAGDTAPLAGGGLAPPGPRAQLHGGRCSQGLPPPDGAPCRRPRDIDAAAGPPAPRRAAFLASDFKPGAEALSSNSELMC